MSTNMWIVIAAVAALLLIAVLVVVVSRARSQHRHRQAQQIREQARTESVGVDRRAALADETAAQARAAQAEADVKAAEAARLREQATQHESEAAAARERLEQRWNHADRIDPKTRADSKTQDADEAWSAESQEPATNPETIRNETYRGAPS